MSTASTRIATRGVKIRARAALNRALGDGALRARLNRGLSRINFELVVKPPVEVREPEFERMLARCAPYTMTSEERMYSVFQAARYVATAGIPGDIVECGVWRGGSSMMAALALADAGERRRFWLYDTFEGMPEPGAEDFGLHGEDPHVEWKRNQQGDVNAWCYAPLEEVRANMASVGVAADELELVVGRVEETVPATVPEQIAILRLDTDWYESTRHELAHLYPRIVSGGVLILDDYGHWGGVRRAVDEYLQEQDIHLLLNRVDYAGRLAVKP